AQLPLQSIGRQMHAESWLGDLAIGDQLADYPIDGIHRDGKANTSVGTRRTVDGGVNANDATVAINERSAGVSRVDGGVGLDHVFSVVTDFRIDLSSEVADDACSQGLIKAEGVANRKDLMTDDKII